jgi:hypothetical protein
MSHLLTKKCTIEKQNCCGEKRPAKKRVTKYCNQDSEIEIDINDSDCSVKDNRKLFLLGALAGTALFTLIRKI